MEGIKQDKIKRDWLNAWTILVLPGLFWFVLLLVNIDKNLFFEIKQLSSTWFNYFTVTLAAVFLVSPILCIIWAVLHFLFVKKVQKQNRVTFNVQLILNIILSLLYLVVIGTQIFYGYSRTCGSKDYLQLEKKPWCGLQVI